MMTNWHYPMPRHPCGGVAGIDETIQISETSPQFAQQTIGTMGGSGKVFRAGRPGVADIARNAARRDIAEVTASATLESSTARSR